MPLLWGKFQALAAVQPPLQLLGEGETAGSAGAPLVASAAAAAAPASEAAAARGAALRWAALR